MILYSLRRFFNFLGFDLSILYSLANKSFSILSRFVSLVLIAKFFNQDEQGYYYTFIKVFSLQVLFELGLTQVVLQFSSHEKAQLNWSLEKTLEGNFEAKTKLAELLHFAMRWYGSLSVVLFLVLLPGGWWFFTHSPAPEIPVVWALPWLLFLLFACGCILLSPLYALLEGCGLIQQIAKMRVGQLFLSQGLFWIGLYFHAGLYAIVLLKMGEFLWGFGWLYVERRAFLKDLYRSKKADQKLLRWKEEILPFQWKIGLSWMSGYFIFHLSQTALFSMRGPIEAGQFGMTQEIADGIFSIPMLWIYTKIATFGALIQQRKFKELDRIFFRSSIVCALLTVLIAAVMILGIWVLDFFAESQAQSSRAFGESILQGLIHFRHRMLPMLPFALLVTTGAINQILFSEAVYLRAHKKEPFLGVSMLNGALVICTIYFLGRPYGATGIALGSMISSFIVVLLGTSVFFKKRREWHE